MRKMNFHRVQLVLGAWVHIRPSLVAIVQNQGPFHPGGPGLTEVVFTGGGDVTLKGMTPNQVVAQLGLVHAVPLSDDGGERFWVVPMCVEELVEVSETRTLLKIPGSDRIFPVRLSAASIIEKLEA